MRWAQIRQLTSRNAILEDTYSTKVILRKYELQKQKQKLSKQAMTRLILMRNKPKRELVIVSKSKG